MLSLLRPNIMVYKITSFFLLIPFLAYPTNLGWDHISLEGIGDNSNWVVQMLVAPSDDLYALKTYGGPLIKVANKIPSVIPDSAGDSLWATSMCLGPEGKVWISSFRRIGIVEGDYVKWVANPIPCRDTSSIYLHGFDPYGNLWFTELQYTWLEQGQGLVVTDFQNCRYFNRDNGQYPQHHAYFAAFSADRGFFGSRNDDGDMDISVPSNLVGMSISENIDLVSLSDDSLYSVLADGITDEENTFWGVGGNKLVRIDDTSTSTWDIPEEYGYAARITVSRTGEIIIATISKNIVLFSHDNFRFLDQISTTDYAEPRCLEVDSVGGIWVGMAQAGLFYLEPALGGRSVDGQKFIRRESANFSARVTQSGMRIIDSNGAYLISGRKFQQHRKIAR